MKSKIKSNNFNQKKYVLTGGPGTGKTTALEILASLGYNIIPETARKILDDEQKKDSDILPWKDCTKFQIVVAEKQFEAETSSKSAENFLDRSLIDGYAYCIYYNVPVPKIIIDKGQNRYDKVFLFEQLPSYKNDFNRKEDKESADLIHKMIKDAYIKFGYKVIDVPTLPPKERVNFILDRI